MKQRQRQKMRAQLWSKKLRMTKEMNHHHHVLLLLQHQHHRKYHYPHPNLDPNSFFTRVQDLPILPTRQEIICHPMPMLIPSSGRHCAVLSKQLTYTINAVQTTLMKMSGPFSSTLPKSITLTSRSTRHLPTWYGSSITPSYLQHPASPATKR